MYFTITYDYVKAHLNNEKYKICTQININKKNQIQ